MKVCTILGTRPEIIRLSKIINILDGLCNHVVVHTGQNFDPKLSDIFFEELGVRSPNIYLNVLSNSFAGQIAQILERIEKVFLEERPDRILLLGDTNSSLTAIIAKRMGIPVFHLEAGNRCYDDRVPEEINRRLIDHSSDVLMPYTMNSRENLLREGIEGNRIYVIGNPIFEVLQNYDKQIKASNIHARLGLEKNKYFLVTMHREENVDVESRLISFCQAFNQLQVQYKLPVVISTHPRTKKKLNNLSIDISNPSVQYHEPFGLFDFIALEKEAFCILSDSGTVQEEACIFGIPNVTIRDVTERPETIECGSNILSGAEPSSILACVAAALRIPSDWTPPREYHKENVSATVAKIVLGYDYRFKFSKLNSLNVLHQSPPKEIKLA